MIKIRKNHKVNVVLMKIIMSSIKLFFNLLRLYKRRLFLVIIALFSIYLFKKCHENKSLKSENFIFVGGFGRSGTTLMRAILDAHPNIRCGPETKLIPLILQWHQYLIQSKSIMAQINDSAIDISILDRAIGIFIKEIIYGNGKLSKRLCDKDPNIAKHISYLKKVFPNSKFILMIRDPRAVVYSYSNIYKRNNSIFLEKIAKKWNKFMENAIKECNIAGNKFCLKVYYEKLVRNSSNELKNIINFVGERWHDSLLNHEKYIGSEIAISKSEWSTNQIKKRIHNDSILLWTKFLPKSFINNFKNFAPMFSFLNYDSNSFQF